MSKQIQIAVLAAAAIVLSGGGFVEIGRAHV